MRRFGGTVLVILCLAAVVECNKQSERRAENQSPGRSEPVSAPAPALHEIPRTGVVINGRELSPQQMVLLTSTYRYAPPRGRYWYDTASGAWGVEGRETYGFILPGHDLGPLAADASAGNTGVFINGREINTVEALGLQRTFGAVYPGHWWLDGRTGNFGLKGNPMPMGNVIEMLRAKGRGAGGDNFWATSTAMGNSSGDCSYVNVGNGQTATSGCD